ncbi:hypothetical protein [Acidovorax sp. BL-A-41-H1]|uniref:hypothetical protein n=1 Tax=Acidovorax sp. BL-A-41-H1 TaxID=3421102 RepID=UPI003F7A61F6
MNTRRFKQGLKDGFQSASLAALSVALFIFAGVGFITTVDVLRGKTPAACIKGKPHADT